MIKPPQLPLGDPSVRCCGRAPSSGWDHWPGSNHKWEPRVISQRHIASTPIYSHPFSSAHSCCSLGWNFNPPSSLSPASVNLECTVIFFCLLFVQFNKGFGQIYLKQDGAFTPVLFFCLNYGVDFSRCQPITTSQVSLGTIFHKDWPSFELMLNGLYDTETLLWSKYKDFMKHLNSLKVPWVMFNLYLTLI